MVSLNTGRSQEVQVRPIPVTEIRFKQATVSDTFQSPCGLLLEEMVVQVQTLLQEGMSDEGVCYRLFGSQGNYPTVVVDGTLR